VEKQMHLEHNLV